MQEVAFAIGQRLADPTGQLWRIVSTWVSGRLELRQVQTKPGIPRRITISTDTAESWDVLESSEEAEERFESMLADFCGKRT